MSIGWDPIVVLPNVSLRAALESDAIVLAPPMDERVISVKRAHPRFRSFLRRFSDTFGQKFEPTVLLVRDDAPAAFRSVEALASFRNAIAIATIALARTLLLDTGTRLPAQFAEVFSIYPWMLDKKYEHLVARTYDFAGIHEVGMFRGQASPMVMRASVDRRNMDEPLLEALLSRWQRHYRGGRGRWQDIALFRSLNMAYHASLLPAAPETTIHDLGRIVSLWVSAFEILVHPGRGGVANRYKVFDLLEKTNWKLRRSARRSYNTGGKIKKKRCVACRLYETLDYRRNDFLHGNPVRPALLDAPSGKYQITDYAIPLYRIALATFLPLKPPRRPQSSALSAWVKYTVARNAFDKPQESAERATIAAFRR